jgi:dienelactone hydrolase
VYWLLRRKRRIRETLGRSVPLVLLLCLVLGPGLPRPAAAAESVTFQSGDRVLHGLLYKPAGAGPFPAVLYNHGSAAGLLSNQAFDRVGPMLAARGWVVFAPYRTGQGLSSDAGPYILDEIRAAQAHGGEGAAEHTMVELLGTTQLQDQMAALAWLKGQPFVAPGRIVAMGNSFGGIETILGVERGGYCAGVDVAGGAMSWEGHRELQDRMVRAVEHATAPILFLQAENDYSVAPSRILHAAMEAVHRPSELRIYPPYGSSADDGHNFGWRGSDVWMKDALAFMEARCRP